MIALESVMGLWFLRRAVPWSDLLRIAFVALLTYAHWFWWHFHLGVKTGACVRGGAHLRRAVLLAARGDCQNLLLVGKRPHAVH
jgi:hypothetical protein